MTPSGHVAFLVISVLLHLSPHVRGSGVGSCNATLTSPTGEIQSPNYPDSYPGGVTCLWHITFGNISNVTGITFFFKKFSTRITNTGTLFEEELLIYTRNPSSVNATPVVYRGQYAVHQSSQNELWLQFTSAQNDTIGRTGNNFLGFDILYTAVIPGESCPNITLPQNTIRIGNHTHVGAYYEYHCNHGYRLVGPSVLLCLLQGGVATWSDTSTSCVDTCSVPSLNNGNVTYSNLYVNSSARFSCTSPYMLKGSSVVACVADRQGLPSWSGEFPQCVIPDCSRVVELRDNTGAIVNPGYATHSVQSNKNCQWKITVTNGLIVHLFFRYFQLPADRVSSLQIVDVGEERVVLLTLFGGQQPRNITSVTNKVEIDYRGPLTDSSSHAGFYIQYEMGSAVALGQGHGTFTPILPPRSTSPPKTTPKVVTTYVDDGSGTMKIAVGVAVPLVILLAVILGLYLWYRKKYPVRMIIGREFAKFTNPDYNVKGTSTLTLVRDDADDFFKTASRATSNVNLVVDEEQGPHYVNVAFSKDENGEVSGVQGPEEPLDEEEEDRELMKRKSYLFTPVEMSDTESAKRKDEESSSDSDSASHSGGSQSSRKIQDVVVTVEQEQDVAVDMESSSDKQVLLSQSDIDNFNSHFPHKPIRKTSVDVLLERSKDRRAFTNEERYQRRFSFDASLSVRGRSLSAKTPAEVSKDAEKLDALLKKSRFSQMTSVEETDDKFDKPGDDVDGVGDENEGDTEITKHVLDDHADENHTPERLAVYENVTVFPNPDILENENAITQNSASPESTNNTKRAENVVSDTRPKSPEHYENVFVQANEMNLETSNQTTEESPNVDTSNDSKDMIPATQDAIERETDSDEETMEEVSSPQYVLEEDKSDAAESDKEDTSSSLSPKQGEKDLDTSSSLPPKQGEEDHLDTSSSLSPKQGEEDLDTSSSLPPKQGVEDHLDTSSSLPPKQGEDTSLDDENGGSQVTKVISESEESEQEDNSKQRTVRTDNVLAHADASDNETGADSDNDESTEDSASVVSTSSNISGTYNFGRTPPESDLDSVGGEEEEVVEEERNKKAGETNSVDQTQEQNSIASTESDTTTSTKELEDTKNLQSDVSESGHRPDVNLDTSSISSLDQSVLDTSVDLSTTSTDSPVMQKRPPTLPTGAGPTKKVTAPVFSIGGDDTDDPSSDVSSSDSEDEDRQRKKVSRPGDSAMPGIQEEDTDSDDGHARSYSFGHGGHDNSDSDGDGGRKFTDDDLLAELSDDSDSGRQSKERNNVVSLTPGMIVFDENLEDDLDV